MNRSPLKRRTRLKPYGQRLQRELEERIDFRLPVLGRANGRCERCGERRTLHAHHILPKGRGGRHEASNGAALCTAGPYGAGCHQLAHDHAIGDWRDWIR